VFVTTAVEKHHGGGVIFGAVQLRWLLDRLGRE